MQSQKRNDAGDAVSSNEILMVLFISCDLFILFVYVALRITFPPVPKFELNDASRDHIEHARRYENQT